MSGWVECVCGNEIKLGTFSKCMKCGTPVEVLKDSEKRHDLAAQLAETKMRKTAFEESSPIWEYHLEQMVLEYSGDQREREIDFYRFSKRLNELGQDGWELFHYDKVPMVNSLGEVQRSSYLAMFKKRGFK